MSVTPGVPQGTTAVAVVADTTHEIGSDGWVVQHLQAEQPCLRLVESGREIFPTEPLFISEVGPVIGTYGGPGMLGVAGAPRELLE